MKENAENERVEEAAVIDQVEASPENEGGDDPEPQDLIEFSSNISLKEEDKKRYQLAYVTQLYGTMLGVFAKPICEYIPDVNGNVVSAKLKEIVLVGVNFKGYVNLELCRERDRPDWLGEAPEGVDPDQALIVRPPVNVGEDVKGIKFNIWVKASLGGIPGTIKEMEVRMPMPDNLYELDNGNYIRIERKVLPFGEPNGSRKGPEIRDNAFANGLFDSEFFSRDGLFVVPEVSKDRAKSGDTQRYSNESFVLDETDAKRIIGNPMNPSLGPAGADTLKCTPANLKVNI